MDTKIAEQYYKELCERYIMEHYGVFEESRPTQDSIHSDVIKWYAMNYLFWIDRKPTKRSKKNDYNEVRDCVCSEFIAYLLRDMERENIVDEVMDAIKDYEKNDSITRMLTKFKSSRQHHLENMQIALEQYNNIPKYKLATADIICPTIYFYKQNELRKFYETLVNDQSLVDESIFQYLKFMYETFPDGYCDEYIAAISKV